MSTGDTVVSIQRLTKSYGSFVALKDVTVDVPSGKVGLLGPNGAGKTTLLKVLLGLLEFDDGQAEVLGHRVLSQDLKVRALTGYMPENDVYLPAMNAVEMCAYAGQLCGLPRREALSRAHESLHFVGLEDKRYQLTETYSTGQKQRAKLACALVHDPELLLLDEPTNGLDPAGRESMLELISSLPELRGCSLVLSTHLLPDVERVCDHVVLLDQGAVLRSKKLTDMTATEGGLLEVRPKAGQKDRLKEALSSLGCDVQKERTRLLVSLPEGAGTDLILKAALDNGLQVRHMARYRRTLQQAFMDALHTNDGTETFKKSKESIG